MHVSLVSPERILWEGEASSVLARTTAGEIMFLGDHAPFIGVLGVGRVRIVPDEGGEVLAAVHGGFVEVKNNRITILSDVAELADQVDVARARAALERAGSIEDEDAAALARRRAEVRLEVAGA